MIDVHYWPTPNGKKVTILLEECDLEYRIVPCSIGRGDQFADEFLAISPNNRMPAIVDHKPADGGEPIAIFESGACNPVELDRTPVLHDFCHLACYKIADVRGQARFDGREVIVDDEFGRQNIGTNTNVKEFCRKSALLCVPSIRLDP